MLVVQDETERIRTIDEKQPSGTADKHVIVLAAAAEYGLRMNVTDLKGRMTTWKQSDTLQLKMTRETATDKKCA